MIFSCFLHCKGVVLVTDAISALGLPSGVHRLGQQTIEIKGNRAVLLGTETLCGRCVVFDVAGGVNYNIILEFHFDLRHLGCYNTPPKVHFC